MLSVAALRRRVRLYTHTHHSTVDFRTCQACCFRLGYEGFFLVWVRVIWIFSVICSVLACDFSVI